MIESIAVLASHVFAKLSSAWTIRLQAVFAKLILVLKFSSALSVVVDCGHGSNEKFMSSTSFWLIR